MALFNKSCASKTAYATHNEARVASLRRLREGPEIYLRVYQCSMCRKFHLTSKRPEEVKDVASSTKR